VFHVNIIILLFIFIYCLMYMWFD